MLIVVHEIALLLVWYHCSSLASRCPLLRGVVNAIDGRGQWPLPIHCRSPVTGHWTHLFIPSPSSPLLGHCVPLLSFCLAYNPS